MSKFVTQEQLERHHSAMTREIATRDEMLEERFSDKLEGVKKELVTEFQIHAREEDKRYDNILKSIDENKKAIKDITSFTESLKKNISTLLTKVDNLSANVTPILEKEQANKILAERIKYWQGILVGIVSIIGALSFIIYIISQVK